MQRCGAPAPDAKLAGVHASGMDTDVADSSIIGCTVRTSKRLTQWKLAAMADCAASGKMQNGANGLQVALSLGMQPGNLRWKERTGSSTRSASGASRRVGSLTNGLP